MKKVRGRWAPTPAQVELVVDCSTAKMPLERAAEIVGVKPLSRGGVVARRAP
jgi:hypothetical protein